MQTWALPLASGFLFFAVFECAQHYAALIRFAGPGGCPSFVLTKQTIMKTVFKTILLGAFAIVIYTSVITCSRKLADLKTRYQSEARGQALGFILDGVIK